MKHNTTGVELCVHFLGAQYGECITEYMDRTEEVGGVWSGFIWLGIRTSARSCEYDNEHTVVQQTDISLSG